MSVQHPVEAALRTERQAQVRQDRHVLPRPQRGNFEHVAGQQDSLAFLFAEAVGHVAVAVFKAVDAIIFTSELTPPLLQRPDAYVEQPCQIAGPSTICHSLVKYLQGLLAVVRRGQSSPSSSQKV